MKIKSLACLIALSSASSFAAVTNLVQIGNFFFNPTNLTINVGDSVRWTNTVAALATHDVTRTNLPFPWLSGDLTTANRTFQLTFTSAGNFPYYCNRHVYANLPSNLHPEQTGTVAVVSANLPPSVSLTNPVANATFRAPTNLLLQAHATDDNAVTNVQFFSGPALLGSVTSPPFQLPLNNAAAGNYSFTARAHDSGGLSATSSPVNVFILTNAHLTAPERLANGQFRFTVQGIAGQAYTAERSTNLLLWTPFATNLAPANTFNITDSTAPGVLERHYRTRQDY